MLLRLRNLLCCHPHAGRSVISVERLRYGNGTVTLVSYSCGRCGRLRVAELRGAFTAEDVHLAWSY